MATPKEALASQNININSQGKASPRNQQIANTDTVSFTNNDPNDIATVTFLAAGSSEFSYQGTAIGSFSVAPGATFGPLSPITSNVTINYRVNLGQNGPTGPFAIQVGAGPLEIDIVTVDGDTNLPTAEIPNNGSIFFKNDEGYSATIHFNKSNVLFDQNGNSVTQQTVAGQTSGAALTGRGTNQDVGYTINMAGHPRKVETGGGTIKVGSN